MGKTDGAKRLAAWLKESKTSQTQFAADLRVGQSTVSRWLSGHLRPEPAYREAIERRTGIEATAWLSKAEKELLESITSAEPNPDAA